MEFPNTVCLATLGADNIPDARMVLLKGHDATGLVFFTNYESNKARGLAAHPQATLMFHWEKIGRAIRIAGDVEKTSAAESDAYFKSRPRDSQIGAWASAQSSEIKSRKDLEERFLTVEKKYAGADIPRPPHWGGYRLKPVRFEFWQEGAHRLHDRARYTLTAQGWEISRLSP